jgi:hypothetical protein
MKKLLFIPVVLLGLSACNMASQDDYDAMASDMCGCFDEVKSELSEDAQNVIIDATNSGKDLEEAFAEYAEEKPMEALKDQMAIMKLGDASVMDCLDGLEKKYDDVYTSESETEIQDRIIKSLESMEGCELTLAIAKLGLAAQ